MEALYKMTGGALETLQVSYNGAKVEGGRGVPWREVALNKMAGGALESSWLREKENMLF